MSFDVAEYAGAMDEFLMKMDKAPSTIHPDIGVVLERMCKLLRIARIEVAFYETPGAEQVRQGATVGFYQKGEADETRFVAKREMTVGNNVVIYKAFQRVGDEDWTEIEREKLDIFIQMIFVFNGRTRAMEMMEYMKYHDRDFGCYNIAYFMKIASMYIAQGRIGQYGACYYNFKRLSAINQLAGREMGTILMKKFNQGLESMLAEDELVARIGGDNFVILFHKDKLKQVQEYLGGQDLVYDRTSGDKVTLSATGGFYMIPEKIKRPTEIMDRVSVAVNLAKTVRRNEKYVFYDESVVRQVENKKMVEAMFPEALANEEFVIFYQPKVDLTSYKLAGAEALSRWFHNGEMIQPGGFIPILESGNAICKLDFYVLEHVCKDIRKWLDEGRNVVRVSINFSRRHLGKPGLLEHILSIIDKYGVPHEYIEIELTETTTDVSFKDLRDIVTGLQQHGIHTSVDDFGVGYSSLNLIRVLPWDIIKIDKSFLEQREDSRGNYIMLKHVISMVHEMGMLVVVEGVETAEHIEMLKSNGCRFAQGFCFDRPLPKEEFEKKICKGSEFTYSTKR